MARDDEERSAFADATEGDESEEGRLEKPAEERERPRVKDEDAEKDEAREETPTAGDTRLAHEEEGEEKPDERDEREATHRSSKERRAARKRTKIALRQQNEFLAAEVSRLTQRLSAVEAGQGDSRLAILDSDLKRCSDEVAQADRIFAAALSAQNGEDAAAAQRLRNEAQRRVDQLSAERERIAYALNQARQQPPQPLPLPGSAQVDQRAAQFRASRPWLQFDPQGRPLNIESGVARTIDVAMRAEGRLDPGDADYWRELDHRLRGALPQMYDLEDEEGPDEEDEEDETEEDTPRTQSKSRERRVAEQRSRADRGPRVGSGGRQGGNTHETVVPPEIVAAIKEAGYWDDPKERKEALEYYRTAGVLK